MQVSSRKDIISYACHKLMITIVEMQRESKWLDRQPYITSRFTICYIWCMIRSKTFKKFIVLSIKATKYLCIHTKDHTNELPSSSRLGWFKWAFDVFLTKNPVVVGPGSARGSEAWLSICALECRNKKGTGIWLSTGKMTSRSFTRVWCWVRLWS